MTTIKRLLLVVIASCAMLGCEDGGPTGATPDPVFPNIVGSWAASSLEFVSTQNAATRAELIAEGLVATFTFNANKSFLLITQVAGEEPVTQTGTYVQTDASLTITNTTQEPGEVLHFTLALSGSSMTLTGATTMFDFGDGMLLPVKLNATLTKKP